MARPPSFSHCNPSQQEDEAIGTTYIFWLMNRLSIHLEDRQSSRELYNVQVGRFMPCSQLFVTARLHAWCGAYVRNLSTRVGTRPRFLRSKQTGITRGAASRLQGFVRLYFDATGNVAACCQHGRTIVCDRIVLVERVVSFLDPEISWDQLIGVLVSPFDFCN